ncbi:MAG: DUF1318 domain-containing protein [Verrucomicrobiota bacterium]
MKKITPFLLLALVSCSPTVRLDTPEPVKIDVNMKVDVTTTEARKTAESKQPSENNPLQTRRQRMAEIQDLKNNRIAGESNNGLLVIVKSPDDPQWKTYAEKLIQEENKDRAEIFAQESKATGKPSELVAKDFAKKMRDAAFPNEWIQTESGEWKQN